MDWKSVQDLRKQGRIVEGKRLAYELLEANSADFRTRSMLEWLLYDEAKASLRAAAEAVKEDKRPQQADLRRIDQVLTEFARLPAERPGMACSVLLQQLCRVGAEYARFAAFVNWVGINGLRAEDWQPSRSDTGSWPPLAVLVARALAKWTKTRETTRERLEETLQWLDAAVPVAEADDRLWLQWDRAGVLRRLERYDDAARALSGVIKAKRNEFWVWAEAGRLYQQDDPDLALACFCQALLCPSSPEFVGKVHRELAELLVERGEYAQASAEISIAASIREEQGWRLGGELEGLMREPWYEPVPPDARKPKAFYSEHAPMALGLCFDEVETRPATFLGMLVLPPPKDAKPGWKPRPRTRFAVISGESGSSSSLLGPHLRKVPWKPGDAVSLVLGRQTGEARDAIVQIIRRSEGKAWDCTETVNGVVTREASEAHSMRVFAGKDIGDVPVHDPAGGEQLRIGDGVTLQLTKNPKTRRIEGFNPRPGAHPESNVKEIRGRLRRVEGKAYAFVDDVFIHPELMGTLPTDQVEVGVMAVYGPHPNKGHGWRAIRISPAD